LFKYISNAALTCALIIGTSVSLFAASHELFGDAVTTTPGYNSPTAVKLTSVGTSFSGIDFTSPEGITLADLETLSADYFFTMGSCGGGSPRFQINVIDPVTNTTKNIFAYFGDAPNYTNCTQNAWTNTGDLLSTGLFLDTSQVGGTFYDPYESAVTTFGSYEVTGIQLVVDGGFIAPQMVSVDNVVINGDTTTFESANTCKNGGWQMFTGDPGPFTNQGQCVSYFARSRSQTVTN